MTARFHVDQQIVQEIVELSGPEHHHMTHVMRLREGDVVVLFDGSGDEFVAEIRELNRSSARMAIQEKRSVSREASIRVTVGVALPKGDRQQWLVEKAVELGAHCLVPLVTERSVAEPKDKALQRLMRWVVGASKQCGRNRLMEVAPPQTALAFFSHGAENRVLVAHPSPNATSFSESIRNMHEAAVFLAVGPEGGFTEREIAEAMARECEIVHLGERILRIETAVAALVAGVVYSKR